jgi:hypothetical protein
MLELIVSKMSFMSYINAISSSIMSTPLLKYFLHISIF